jgi:hypothetical protein
MKKGIIAIVLKAAERVSSPSGVSKNPNIIPKTSNNAIILPVLVSFMQFGSLHYNMPIF